VEILPAELPVEPAVWFVEPDRSLLVLGSSQSDGVVDHLRCAAAGVTVTRRRSGGGAVLLEPGQCVWAEVVVPAGNERWDHDVVRSAFWLGEAVQRALGTGEVHRSRLVSSVWSSAVCFAGLGPGEVTVEGRKVAGISQRRTKAATRMQLAVLGRWDAERLCSLMRLGDAAVLDLDAVATGVDLTTFVERFGDEIASL
jgi:lipoate-protein ligase A